MSTSRRHAPSGAGRRRTALGVAVCAALLLSLALAAAAGAAEPRTIFDTSASPTWHRDINGSGTSWDAATSVLADSSGAWVAGWAGNAAGNWDATLQRYSITGTAKWATPRRYDGPAHGNDVIWKLAKGPGGTVYGAGWSVASNGKTNVLVIKWSKTGSRLWARTYDGAAHGPDAAVALGVDKYGNVIAAGSSRSSHGLDYIVIKWSSTGVRKWVWRYDGSAHQDDAATDIHVLATGACYVTGHVKAAATPTAKDAARTVKLSAAGAPLWSKSTLGVGGLGAWANALAARPAGGVYIAGWTKSLATEKDIFMMRYSASGSPQLLPPTAVALDDDDILADVAVGTNKQIMGVGSRALGGNTDLVQAIWRTETATPFGNANGGPFDDAYTAVTADASGGTYGAGYMRTAADKSQIFTRRTSLLDPSSGFTSNWGPNVGLDLASAVAVSGTTAYVVGWTNTLNEGINQVILAYTY